MTTTLIAIAAAVPLLGAAAYVALLIWAARADGRHQREFEEHGPDGPDGPRGQ